MFQIQEATQNRNDRKIRIRTLQAVVMLLLLTNTAYAQIPLLFQTEDKIGEAYGMTIHFAECAAGYHALSALMQRHNEPCIAKYLYYKAEEYKTYALMLTLYAEIEPSKEFVETHMKAEYGRFSATFMKMRGNFRVFEAWCATPPDTQERILNELRKRRLAITATE